MTKVSIGKSGYGAAHASYITRLSALDPPEREMTDRNSRAHEHRSLGTDVDDIRGEMTVQETLKDTLDDKALNAERSMGGDETTRDVDPIWSWNAPGFLTGERQSSGMEPARDEKQEPGNDPKTRLTDYQDPRDRLTLPEKVDNLKLYFRSREEFEKKKGGRTHYRIILSFDVPATNQQIRDLANEFLGQAFPKAIGFGAIHRDTDHPHAHIYLHSRQIDGKRIQLKNSDYRSIDEKWAKIYSDFAGDRSSYIEHLRKKEETRLWKIAAGEAYRKGEAVPPKPERDADRRERLAEQRLSAERSEARDQGKQLESGRQAEPLSRAASEKETSRLLAKTEVAREQLAHLIRTDAPEKHIKSAARMAHELTAVLEKTLAMRKEMGREQAPQVVYTTEEWKQLKEYAASRDLPVRSDQSAARLQAAHVMAGAELTEAHEKAEAFQTSRHFWKFEVEGWDGKLSLKEVDQAIKSKSEERLKLYNFLRPERREHIQRELDYLRETKKDVQKQLAALETNIGRNVGAATLRYQIAGKQVEQAAQVRANQARPMPSAVHTKDEIVKINEIAVRNKDGPLLRYGYEQVKDRLLANPTQEALSHLKGFAVMAEMEMLSRSERLANAIHFGEFRQLPLKNAQDQHYTKSVREVAPRNALEAVIRHFTDSSEQKRERNQLADTLRQQLERAQEQSTKARDYNSAMKEILADHCRAAGVRPDQVKPSLDSQQIAEVREFSERQPLLSRARGDFSYAARQAEELHRERETARAARQGEEARSNALSARSREQSEVRQNPRASDRDVYSRGR